MMTRVGILFKEFYNCSKNLIVRTFASIEDAQLLFHYAEQLFDISVFLAQDLDDFDHRILPPSARRLQSGAVKTAATAADNPSRPLGAQPPVCVPWTKFAGANVAVPEAQGKSSRAH